jgi:hypothetical protein
MVPRKVPVIKSDARGEMPPGLLPDGTWNVVPVDKLDEDEEQADADKAIVETHE